MQENEDLREESEEAANATSETKEQQEVEEIDPVANLENQVKEERDKYMRLYAEFENFRRRSAKERIDLIGSATSDLMKEVLPVLDDFERAIESNKSVEDIAAIKEGFELLYTKTAQILQSKGLKVIESRGEVFDAEIHEAVAQIPAPEGTEKGSIIDVIERGYTLNEKIIRHPKVVVAS